MASQAPRAAVRAAREQRHFDVAELFAFVCPARFATPTPVGFARSLALDPGADDEETLRLIAEDRRSRSIDLLLTSPIGSWAISSGGSAYSSSERRIQVVRVGASPSSGRMMSIGTGKMVVELFSAATSRSVCR